MVSRLTRLKRGILFSIALLCVALQVRAQTFNQFSPGGDLAGVGSTWNSQIIANSAVTLAKQANLLANTIQCNGTSSAAAPQACNPLQVGILGSYVLSAHLASTANVTLSGVQTIDGILAAAGQAILLKNQSTASQNGLWIMQVGAWTRPINFPSGYVLPTNCTVDVFIEAGAANVGHTFALITSSVITIDTTAETWNNALLANATVTASGLVKVTSNAAAGVVASEGVSPTGAGGAMLDCVSFNDVAGSVGDLGSVAQFNVTGGTGPCVTSDANGHPLLQAAGTAPTVNHGSIAAGGSDNRGQITGLVAQTSVTLTFNTAMPAGLSCVATENSATPVAVSTTAISTAAVTFATAVAFTGTIYYLCF